MKKPIRKEGESLEVYMEKCEKYLINCSAECLASLILLFSAAREKEDKK